MDNNYLLFFLYAEGDEDNERKRSFHIIWPPVL